MKTELHVSAVTGTNQQMQSNTALPTVDIPGLEIATDMVPNATNIFSLVTKNSGLVAKYVATRFFYDLDLN